MDATQYTNTRTGETKWDHELESDFNEYVDQCNPMVAVHSYGILPHRALQYGAPVEWREAFNNWLDAEQWDED